MAIEVGSVVRHCRWGGRFVGTVTHRDGNTVAVAWYGSFVEDQLEIGEVEVCTGRTGEIARWRGGIGIAEADGTTDVEPIEEQ